MSDRAKKKRRKKKKKGENRRHLEAKERDAC